MDWHAIKDLKTKMDQKGVMKFLRGRSVMNQRLVHGNNVVIYGASTRPIGRTMIASIIMKEAIKLRITQHARKHTYDWIDFNTLVHEAKKESVDLTDYRSCDFLVVDNITNPFRTVNQNTFIVDVIDPFFIGRFRDKLLTILVFKFDITNPSLLIENAFGGGMNQIIDSKRTYKIKLSDTEESVNDGG